MATSIRRITPRAWQRTTGFFRSTPTSAYRTTCSAEIRALLASEPAVHGYRMPRVSFYLGRWMRTTDMYPDYQLRLYDRRHARWDGMHVHESVKVETGVGRLSQERAAALPL